MSKVTESRARDFWMTLLEELASSGERPKKFAARHGVNVQTLYWWRSKVRREGAISTVQPSRRSGASAESRPASTLPRSITGREFPLARVVRGQLAQKPKKSSPVRVMVGSVRISLDTGFDREVLSNLLSVLGVEVLR